MTNRNNMERYLRALLKLIKYSAFLGIVAAIASFIGPNHSILIKSGIGIIIGCLILGKRCQEPSKNCLTQPLDYLRVKTTESNSLHSSD